MSRNTRQNKLVFQHRKTRSNRYDIVYKYEADGNIYTGKIHRIATTKKLGETFEIKYNPDSPKDSTRYLELTPGSVISGVIGFIVFGFIGWRMIRDSSF